MEPRSPLFFASAALVCAWAAGVHAQYDDYTEYGPGYDSAYDSDSAGAGGPSALPGELLPAIGALPPVAATVAGSGSATDETRVADALYCDGVRYPLEEEREDTGPARLVRLRELTRTINVVGRALDPDRCGGSAEGECIGLRKAVERAQFGGLELFQPENDLEACMVDPIRTWNQQEGTCQELRQNMSDLRRLDREALARAEYVLAARLCDNAASLDANVRSACDNLRAALAPHIPPSGTRPAFWLEAPLPRSVQEAIRRVRLVTGGNFDVDALGSDLARGYRCETAGQSGGAGAAGSVGYLVGLCKEYDLLRRVSDACRLASLYIDERGDIHASAGLSGEDGRAAATLCVDVSDFAPDYPLMVTVRLGANSSRPARVWPGEPIFVGHNLTGPADTGDVLGIEVRGKPRGISLAETLRVNGVPASSPDSCRIARAYVPVVDHEVPVGGVGQAVIPLSFHSGRVGETGTVTQGDNVVIWVRDIEPSGAVRVEYGDDEEPQYVGYIPPPLLGESQSLPADQQAMEALRPPGAYLRPSAAGVDQPLAPRRARYPGSRVLRLGYPAGFFDYPVTVCTYSGERAALAAGGAAPALAPSIASCSDPRATTIVSEHIYVHGTYYFGIRAGLMGTWFPARRLAARRTADAVVSGSDTWQVVTESDNVFDFDVNLLLAIYPFGRDPYEFDYRFWDFSGGHYWNDVAILAGFSMIQNPLDHMYLGLSLPLYSGVALTVLAHFERRGVPVGVRAGDMFQHTGEDPDIGTVFGTERQYVTGVAFGLSVDYDLFERAFRAIYDRIAGVPVFQSSGSDYGGW